MSIKVGLEKPTAVDSDESTLLLSKGKEQVRESGKGLFNFLGDWDWKALLYLTGLAFVVRLAFLHHPSVVVFDEVHFGGFAQKYLTGQFFLDLHPPLARLLVTLSAWVGGFDGKFTFYNIGVDYIRPNVPYITMRAFTATLGALVVPIAYATMRGMGLSCETAAAVSTMTIFENGLTTQSRLILLDSYLVFFTALTGLFWVLFRNQSNNAFSRPWKISLLGLGASMALAASCKWVGLFLVAGVGIYTIGDLWRILGDTRIPLSKVGRHFFSRVVGLILLPISLYMLTFYVHFALQTNFNAGASSMSIGYQQSLHGGQVEPCPKDLYFGAVVRLRQFKATGPFLHSHVHMYPAGSKQQQITGYHHRDQNNLWIIRRPFMVNITYVTEQPDEHDELVRLRHGDQVRIEHIATGRFLHSHPVEPPVSNKDHYYEVSGYGHNPQKFSDLNDNWRILLVDEHGNDIAVKEGQEMPPVHAMSTFKLVHSMLGCALMTGGRSLPEWGFKQNEITCSREAKRSNLIWAIEHNEHPKMPADTEKISYKASGFLSKFIELNTRMWQTNAGLSADHPFASRPMSWFWLSRGLGFWNGNHVPDIEKVHRYKEDLKNGIRPMAKAQPLVQVDENGEMVEADPNAVQPQAEELELTPAEQQEAEQLALDVAKFKGCQIYLIGNPIFWWATTGTILAFVATLALYRLASRRGFQLAKAIEATPFGSNLTLATPGGFMFLQWLFHFLPFFGMQRQLFLHHYFPALYFAILLFSLLLETVLNAATDGINRVKPLDSEQRVKVRRSILYALTMLVVLTFVRFAPLGYGFSMTQSQCNKLKWLARWDFDCSALPDPIGAVATTTAG